MTTWRRAHGVRVRLTLAYLAAILVVLMVYGVAVLTFVRRNAATVLDEQLRGDFGWVAAWIDYTVEGGFMWTEPEVRIGDEVPWVQVWNANAEALVLSSAEARRRPIPDSQQLARQVDDRIVSAQTDEAAFRILTRRGALTTARGAEADVPFVIQVARPETAMREQLREAAILFALGLPLAVAVAGFGGYTLAARALRPIERMTERARSITAERLSDRLPVHNADDEMGRLATVFNETLGRLEASFEQMRRFTSDVSHELRTPLTAIRSVGEVGLRGGHRDEAAYRSIIGSMLEEADRLAGLVDRLLTLSRAESRQASLRREAVDLPALAEEVAAHLGVLAEEKGQTLVVEHGGGVATALADRLVLRQALINLVDNAIKFTPAGGAIRIRVSGTSGEAICDVRDSGPGVSAEARGRIFDRFYREEGGEAGGSGLGLSIAKGAVEANGGRLTLEHSGHEGTTFRITMPRAA